METTATQTKSFRLHSKTGLWTGRIISGLCVLFQLLDAAGKIFLEKHSVDGSAALGLSTNLLPGIGLVLLACTILYMIPRTAILGAMLLTAYLGGATAIMVRAGLPVYFSIIFGILVWVGLYLRNEKARVFLS